MRHRSLPSINSTKHINQQSLFTVASGAIGVRNIVTAVSAPSANLPAECREGAVIKAVFCEMWLTSDDATQGSAIVTLEKKSASDPDMTASQSAALFTYLNKKNILYTFMGLTPPNIQFPTPTIRGWFKIPKGKQRFGLGDKLNLNVHGQSNGVQACGNFIFKEYF